VILGAVYMLQMYRNVFFGPVTMPEREKAGDVGKGELGYLVPIVATLFLLGVFPNLVLRKTEPSVKRVVQKLEAKQDAATQRHGR
jgi:NADH-quinone oxidoreductase subunit M